MQPSLNSVENTFIMEQEVELLVPALNAYLY